MRRQGASIFIYVIFGILIAVFVINFGPQNKGHDSGGCTGTSNSAIVVDGSPANFTAMRIAFSNHFNHGNGTKGKQYVALETLIRREILADTAASHGLDTTAGMADDEMRTGSFFLGGYRLPGGWMTLHGNAQVGQELIFDHEKFNPFVKNTLNVSSAAFLEEQSRSLLAHVAQQMLLGSTIVTIEEARAHYRFEHTTVSYDAVVFRGDEYRTAMKLTNADAARFLAAHPAAVKARFQRDETTHYNLSKEQRHLREVFIAKADDAAKKKLAAARADVIAKKKTMAEVARELSTDDVLKADAGDIGWRSAESPQLPEKTVNDAVKQLKVGGDPTEVIATDKGAYLVAAEGTRTGQLKWDDKDVQLEAARDVAREEWSKEKARRDADAALADALAGKGKNLADVYPLEKPAMPEMTPDQERALEEYKRQIQEQMNQQPKEKEAPGGDGAGSAGSAGSASAGSGERHARVEAWSKDQPAAWTEAEEKTAAGSGTGSGSGSGSGAKVGAGKEDYSKDELPKFGEMKKPHGEHFGPMTRNPVLPAVGSAADAKRALFDELSPGNVAKRVYDGDGGFVLVQLLERRTADFGPDFDKQADWLINEPCHLEKVPGAFGGPEQYFEKCGLRATRARKLVEAFLKQRCDELVKDNKIHPNDEYLTETDEKTGQRVQSGYKPCQIAPQIAPGHGLFYW
jgi:parvulin-like peptidyl-prolyl isomerase